MLPRLDYKETNDSDAESKSVWWFLDESMRRHKAPLLERLSIQLGPQCPVDVDVLKWVAKAFDRPMRWLNFELLWNSEPTRMPQSLYTCKTLARLNLSGKILMDVPSPVFLPSLAHLNLHHVVYKDKDSQVRLLSSCPVLKCLRVTRPRDVDDNVRKFSVKVPSLLRLSYMHPIFQGEDYTEDDTARSLVIDTPALVYLEIIDSMGDSCSIEYMPLLVKASIDVDFNPDANFLRYLSGIKCLVLVPDKRVVVPWYNTGAVKYSRLIECNIRLFSTNLCESLVVLLSSCPKLKVLLINCKYETDNVPILWTKPGSVPTCLSSHLEIFQWIRYAGREDEKELIRFIVENSKYLKMARVSLRSTCSAEEKHNMIEELKCMHRVSTTYEPLFSA